MDYRQVIGQVRRGAAPMVRLGFLSFGVRTTGDPAAAIRWCGNWSLPRPERGIDAIVPMAAGVETVARQRFMPCMGFSPVWRAFWP